MLHKSKERGKAQWKKDGETDDDECFYNYKKQFSTLDLGSMRSNLGIKSWHYRWFAYSDDNEMK